MAQKPLAAAHASCTCLRDAHIRGAEADDSIWLHMNQLTAAGDRQLCAAVAFIARLADYPGDHPKESIASWSGEQQAAAILVLESVLDSRGSAFNPSVILRCYKCTAGLSDTQVRRIASCTAHQSYSRACISPTLKRPKRSLFTVKLYWPVILAQDVAAKTKVKRADLTKLTASLVGFGDMIRFAMMPQPGHTAMRPHTCSDTFRGLDRYSSTISLVLHGLRSFEKVRQEFLLLCAVSEMYSFSRHIKEVYHLGANHGTVTKT